MKYEARTKDREKNTYGVFNFDMYAFQYITDWNGTETLDLQEAVKAAEMLNSSQDKI